MLPVLFGDAGWCFLFRFRAPRQTMQNEQTRRALMGSKGEEAAWVVGVGREASGSLFPESWEPGGCAGPRLVMKEEGGT